MVVAEKNHLETKLAEVEPNPRLRAEPPRETPPAGREPAAPDSTGAPGNDEPLFSIDETSDLPLWVQLRNRLAHLIRTGYFKAGEQLPSLRSLSGEAKVNYNTVTKAYRDLESSGLIVSVHGRGMYVERNVTVDDSPEHAVDAMAEQCVQEYRALGLTYRDIQRRLANIVQDMADEAVAAANEGFPSPFLPGTVGVLALFAEHKLHYAYIGDSNGILISNGTLSYFTTPQTAEVHRRRKEFTSDEIRAVICNNPSHPCGYGVWNGMPSAAEFLRVGELPLSAGDRVLLCTDGIDPFLVSLPDKAIAAMDADTLISQAMAYMMPEGYMDDRTAIVINILDV